MILKGGWFAKKVDVRVAAAADRDGVNSQYSPLAISGRVGSYGFTLNQDALGVGNACASILINQSIKQAGLGKVQSGLCDLSYLSMYPCMMRYRIDFKNFLGITSDSF